VAEEYILIMLRFAEEGAAMLDETSAKLKSLGADAELSGAQASGAYQKAGEDAESMGSKVETAAGDMVSAHQNIRDESAKTTEEVGKHFGKMEGAVSHTGGAFERLGEQMGNYGIPFAKTVQDAGKAFERFRAGQGSATDAMAAFGKLTTGVSITAVIGFGAASVKAAGDFEELITQLQTGANESASNLKMVGNGLLTMSTQVGISADELAKGMFYVESAGFHGAKGLAVMQAAAEGAKVGGSDVATMANAVTSALKAYNLPASKATAVTSELVETVASGKMHMQDLSSALGSVLPVAAAAHISLAQLGGVIATATGQGMSAHRVAMNLANAIRSLSSPTSAAVKEMEQLGLSSVDIAQHLGSRGLTGTMDLLQETIMRHMGPAGLVMMDHFNQAKSATADLKTMIDSTSPSVRKLATELLNNQITAKDYTKATEGMNLPMSEQASQILAVAKQAAGFNDLLKAGGPAVQTYAGALQKLTGNAQAMQIMLLTTGPHAADTAANVAAIAHASQAGAKQVQGFSVVQKDFNFQLDQMKESVNALSISFGEKLIPILEHLARVVMNVVGWLEKHKAVALALAAAIGTVLTGAIGAYVGKTIGNFVRATGQAIEQLLKLLGIMKTPPPTPKTPPVQCPPPCPSPYQGMAEQSTQEVQGTEQAGEELVGSTETMAGESAGLFSGIADAMGPIGMAAGALIPVVMLVMQHWKQIWGVIQSVVQTVWKLIKPIFDDIKNVVMGAFDFIRAHLGIIMPIILGLMMGPFGAIVGYVITHFTQVKTFVMNIWNTVTGFLKGVWDTIQKDATAAWDAISNFFSSTIGQIIEWIMAPIPKLILFLVSHWTTIKNDAISAWDAILNFFESVPGKIINFFSSLPQSFLNLGKQIVSFFLNGLADLGKDILGLLEKIPVVGRIIKMLVGGGVVGKAVHIAEAGAHLAHRAVHDVLTLGGLLHQEGGIITRPTLSMVGEAGPEVILPLNDINRSMQLLAQSGLLSAVGAGGYGGLGGTVGGYGGGFGGGFGAPVTVAVASGAGATNRQFDQLMARLYEMFLLMQSTDRESGEMVAEQRATTQAVTAAASKIAGGIVNEVDKTNADLAQLLARRVR
jgi:Phage-related minor tail protein